MVDLFSDTNIYKNTYHELVLWVKELNKMLVRFRGLEEKNWAQAKRIMELEFDLARYSVMMVEDRQETVVKEYGTAKSNVVSEEEFQARRLKRKTGGGSPPEGDWLSPMVWGTEFLVRPKVQKTWVLARFMMAGIRQGMVLVIPMRGDEPVQDDKEWIWVDPIEFCKYWELMAIMLIPENEDE